MDKPTGGRCDKLSGHGNGDGRGAGPAFTPQSKDFLCSEIPVQDVFNSYLRYGPLVCRPFSANNRKQTDKMNQPVKPFEIVLLLMSGIVFIRKSAVAIRPVVRRIKQSNIMQQGFVFQFPAAFGVVFPFAIAGSVKSQNVTYFPYGIPILPHFLNTAVPMLLSNPAQCHLRSISLSFLAQRSPFPIVCSAPPALGPRLAASPSRSFQILAFA